MSMDRPRNPFQPNYRWVTKPPGGWRTPPKPTKEGKAAVRERKEREERAFVAGQCPDSDSEHFGMACECASCADPCVRPCCNGGKDGVECGGCVVCDGPVMGCEKHVRSLRGPGMGEGEVDGVDASGRSEGKAGGA
jgi:hypothetical protein